MAELGLSNYDFTQFRSAKDFLTSFYKLRIMDSKVYWFFGIGIPACGILVVLFVRLLKWLGNKKGFELIRDNWMIAVPMATMLIFAFMIGLLLYVFSVIFGGGPA